MHLRAIRLNGFKSFADQTELRFERGVTAVVGPNGCGKSNIADAIRWVLGEQSAKALRGGKMHDVIFSGTDSRKPLPICEVSLLLTECETELGSEYHEIEITRRVSRDGGSDYLLNGRSCRLKDIQRLFMDTGIGRTSYSIMAQGQIDQILSSKPEERRVVFEEAAGITKYKSQRREALNKLALVDANLSRITDVIGEVSRQIGSLRRQASKAVRYKKLSHRRRHLELAHGNFVWRELQSSVHKLEDQASGSDGSIRQMQEELEQKNLALAGRKGERQNLNERIQEAQQGVFDLRSKREQALNQAHLSEVRRAGLLERIDQARQDLVGIEEQLTELAGRVDSGVQDRQFQLDLVGTFDTTFRDRSEKLDAVERALGAAEKDLQERKLRLLEADSSLVRLRNEAANLEVDLKTTEHRIARLGEDRAEASTAADEAAGKLADFESRLDAARQARELLKESIEKAREGAAEALADFRGIQTEIQGLDRQIAQKTARQKLLQQLHDRLEGFGEGSKALLQGRLKGAFEGQSFTAVTDGFKVNRRHSRAVETLLGSALEAVAVADEAVAGAVLRELNERKIGSGVVRFPVAERALPESAAVPIPEGLRPAGELITCAESENGTHPVAALLAPCYVAESLEGFLSWWKENPGFPFLLVATIKGELIDRRGLVHGGFRKENSGGILEREVELRETTEEIAADGARLESLRAEAAKRGEALEAAEKAVEQRRQEQSEAVQETARLETETRNAARSLDELKARVERLDREQAGLEENRTRAAGRLAANRQKLSEAEAASAQVRGGIEKVESQIAEFREERDRRREEHAQARFELAEKKQKLDLTLRGLSEMGQRRATLEELKKSREREIDSWGEQCEGLAAEHQEELNRAESLAVTVATAQESVTSIKGRLLAVEEAVSLLEKEQAYLREQVDGTREGLNQVQIRLAKEQSQITFLLEEMIREHQTDLKLVDWRFELWLAGRQPEGIRRIDDPEDDARSREAEGNGDAGGGDDSDVPDEAVVEDRKAQPTTEELAAFDTVDWSAVKAECEALRGRLNAMGPVNLVAIEEYSELKQRHEFLENQSRDLVRSKEQLLEAIDEINRTSQEQFTATFEQIRTNFAETFKILFGGGRSGLELVASDDPLESGIEIVAQPPGTRLQNVSLLSGGQRTMTAVALLFAIYMVKPSPFCVLDELDAPLDESNIGRFTTLLRQFTDSSQFIIITHNKRTIAAAQAIYGITMEEKGVSKVVSMRFHTEHHESEMAKLAVAAAD
ncbi:MAG: chromosome segregation protein SMC [Opitutaceae bacterium]